MKENESGKMRTYTALERLETTENEQLTFKLSFRHTTHDKSMFQIDEKNLHAQNQVDTK